MIKMYWLDVFPMWYWYLIPMVWLLTFSEVLGQTPGDNGGNEGQIEYRKPQFPLKTKSMIYSAEDIRFARRKIRSNAQAGKYANALVNTAEKWIGWKDEDLMHLISDATVPRSFDVGVSGCPIHGETVFKNGRYSWILDPKKPFTIESPVGHETYPSNDFQAYYESSYQVSMDTTKKYTDNGWGWKGTEGEKFWFVAYANQWMLLDIIRPAIRDLGRAYLITGRTEFAHKALVLLYRLAEVYPFMDYEDQSRYGQMQKKNGNKYPGKVVNHIWECFFIQDVAESYDAVWGYLRHDSILQQSVGKNGSEIQSFIEANLLEEAVESYKEGKILGNFGMHQLALVYILLARQNMENKALINEMIYNVSKDYRQTGIKYALYNFVFRDGIPMESPGYNTLWIRSLAQLGEKLKKFGKNIFEMERMEDILKSPMALTIDDQYTVDVGDSGSILGGVEGREQNTYEIAFMNYTDSLFLDWIAPLYRNDISVKKSGMDIDKNFETLFRPAFKPVNTTQAPERKNSSRIFAGYGMGILEGSNNDQAVAVTYGMHGSHYHWDFLNFELFAHGQKMMPDFGYPDAMNTYVSDIYTWSKNTSAHNTVVVDEKKQDQNLPGTLHDFSIGKYVQTIDVSSPAYSITDTYRRHMIRVGSGKKGGYLVDFFRVKGGNRHDYILHGPPGMVICKDTDWGEKLPGTYAGEDVAIKEIYDDEKMSAPDYTGGFSGYAGSGFQHLFNVQQNIKGEGILHFRHVNDDNARLKIHVLTTSGQELYMADAYDLPRTKNYLIRHLICHSQSPGDTLSNTFISVLEPYYKKETESSATQIALASGSSWSRAVRVTQERLTDIIISDSEGSEKILNVPSIKTDAKTAVISYNEKMDLQSVFFSDGTYLSADGQLFTARGLQGRISGIDYPNRTFTIELDREAIPSEMESLNKNVVFFPDTNHKTEHPVSTLVMNGEKLTVRTTDDLIIGYLNVSNTSDENQILETNNALVFEETYIGAYILNEEYAPVGRVISVEDGKMEFSGDKNKLFNGRKTANIWIANIGNGDKAVFKTKFEWVKNK